jgi:hypothetical protein
MRETVDGKEWMILKRKWFLSIFLGMIVSMAMLFSTSGASGGEYLVFSQRVGEEQRLYVAKSDGADLQTVCSGKGYTVFFLGTHLFYFQDHQLYRYDFSANSSQFLARFDDDRIFLNTFTDEPDSPEQVLIITQNEAMKTENWYILDCDDNSIRRISKSLLPVTQTGSIQSLSPDSSYQTQIRKNFSYRFGLELRSSGHGKMKAKTLWTLPKNMTVIPEPPVWAPNSEMFAFYGKDYQDNPVGFYTLFLYDIKQQKLITIQERVFAKVSFSRLEMGEFSPAWTDDGKYLIIEYQPYGLPTESSILKYDVESGKKTYLGESQGTKGYPLWSHSGQVILFLAKQKGEDAQVYTMDAQGENLTRISPQEGFTEWAGWYKPRRE